MVDTTTHTPAYKETAVRMELLPDQGSNPLQTTNFRFNGKRTPQIGVQVERKWKRSDYKMPGSDTAQTERDLVQITTP
jgi:formate dehydrogenase major subunit